MSATLTRQAYTAPALTPRPLVNSVLHGDCLEALRTLPDNSVDAVVSDPPAGINFMNMSFDSDKGGRDAWIAWLTAIMHEALRVTKPGGHALIWALPRTSHWTATALEDAGWEIRDVLAHLFGSGFPKSHNISVAIDKHLHAEREVIGKRPEHVISKAWRETEGRTDLPTSILDITAPATPEAAQWAGFGTSLKPSHENWILARKPLAEKTVAANVLRYGTGGLNIDKSRIGNDNTVRHNHAARFDGTHYNNGKSYDIGDWQSGSTQGRFPSNTLFSHTLLCRQVGTRKVQGNNSKSDIPIPRKVKGIFSPNATETQGYGYADADGLEEVDAWECDPACPVHQLSLQSGQRASSGRYGESGSGKQTGLFGIGSKRQQTYFDEGTAARYFAQFAPDLDDIVPFAYFSKPSRKERNAGCESLPEIEQRIAGAGHTIPRCPEHDAYVLTATNNYKCGCPIRYEKRQQFLKLRDDLTLEQRDYVLSELAKIGGAI